MRINKLLLTPGLKKKIMNKYFKLMRDFKEKFENTNFNINVVLNIEIIRIKGYIPEENKEDFEDWLKHKAIECGRDYHVEYYAYSEDSKDDVEVAFYVKLKKIN